MVPPRRAWLTVSALYAGLALLYSWPLLGAFGTRLPGDAGDPGLNAWILWWNAQAVPLTDHWWNAPAFFPLRGAFALSETLLGVAPLTSPMQWAGESAVVAHNAAYVLSFFLAALSAHALARRLTGRHDAALIAGLGFGFNPYRAAQVFHLQLLMSFWMPLGLLALHRFLDKRRRRDLILFAVCWLLNGLTTGYFLFFFAVLFVCWVAWFVRTWRDAIAIAGAAAIGFLPLVPWLVGYTRHQQAFGLTRGLGEIEFFSADFSAIWAASPFAWLPSHWTLAPHPEGELYPGAVVLILAVIGGVLAWRGRDADLHAPETRRPYLRLWHWWLAAAGTIAGVIALTSWLWGGWQLSIAGVPLSTSHPYKSVSTAVWLLLAAALVHPRLAAGWRRRSPLLFYCLGAGVMFVFALGPLAHAFGYRFLYVAPYAWLMQLPGGHALRVPARFATLVELCLTQAAALTFVRFGRPSWIIVAALSLAVVLDGWVPKLKTEPIPAPLDLAGVEESTALLELPSSDLYADTAAMLRATRHGRRVVNGFSGYQPPHYAFLQQGLRELDASVFPALGRFGSLLVVVDRARDEDGRYRKFVADVPGARLVQTLPIGSIFMLPQPGPEAISADLRSAGGGVALKIRTITDLGTGNPVSSLIDDDLATTWPTRSAAAPSGLRVAFDKRVTILRIELDLGSGALAYPARVSVSLPDRTVVARQASWKGGTAGAAVLAALEDPFRIPMTLDVSPAPPTDQVLITLDGDRPATWRIAELRLYGQ